MFQVGKDWNPKQARLREIVLSPDNFDDAIRLCLELHSIVHCSDISHYKSETLLDEIWEGLTSEAFAAMPMPKGKSIAWNIWHVTRIEDLAANILIRETEQVLDNEWLKRLNVTVKDTGNAMTNDEIASFSQSISMDELRNYRNAVGLKTKNVLTTLTPSDMGRKVNKESIERILAEGGVTTHSDSIWLLDFWGRKNIAGILLMPVTRHQIMHLNGCVKLKKRLTK